MWKTYVITSGYYNPIHPGHIECFFLAKELGDELWVIVNNDIQAELKRWCKSFQDNDFRMKVVAALQPVDEVVLSIDDYQIDSWEIPVIKSLGKVAELIRKKDPDAKLIFAKWWDRVGSLGNIPESVVFEEYDIELRDGLWEKTHHSRDYIVLE